MEVVVFFYYKKELKNKQNLNIILNIIQDIFERKYDYKYDCPIGIKVSS